jgi:hypothetical protein
MAEVPWEEQQEVQLLEEAPMVSLYVTTRSVVVWNTWITEMRLNDDDRRMKEDDNV